MIDQALADDGFERSPSGSGSRRYLNSVPPGCLIYVCQSWRKVSPCGGGFPKK